MSHIKRAALPLLVPAGLLLVWLVWSNIGQSLYFPPLQDILRAFATEWFTPRGWGDISSSLTNLAVGFGIAVVAGVAIGVLIGKIEWLREFTQPVFDFLRGLPAPALLPLSIMLLGIGAEQKIGIIAFGGFFPVLMNTIDGIASVDPTVQDMSRVYRLKPTARLFRVALPAAGPQIMAGCRVALSFGLMLMVVSEMVSSFSGIGYYTVDAQRTYQYLEMWAGLVLLALLGFVLNKLFDVVEGRVLRWQCYR